MSSAKNKQGQADISAPLPLNRKYRPQSFDTSELVGQEHIVRTLKNAVRSDRIAPAYLFCGPRGTGKTSTARILAKAVNCLDPDPDRRPCNVCSSCAAINSSATPDVIEIDAASNRGIDDIRDLRDRVRYAPTQIRIKFYIIDEAHQITGAAANAFLKTLEEPPDHAKFILATTDPEELLPTIVSRCQRFDFRRHSADGIARRIASLADREGIKLSADALTLVAELAHGSMRDPIGLLDQLANYQSATLAAGEELTAHDIRDLVGITRSEVALAVLSAISEGDAAAALVAINEAVSAGQDPRQLNRQLVSLLRDALYLASGAKTVDEPPGLQSISQQLGLDGLLRVASTFSDTDSSIRSAVIPQLPLEMSVLESILGPAQSAISPAERQSAARPSGGGMARPDGPRDVRPVERSGMAASGESGISVGPDRPSTRLRDMIRDKPGPRLESESQGSIPSKSPLPVVEVNNGAAVPPNPDITIEHLVELWPKIRADIKSLDRRTEALLMEIDPVGVSSDEILLAAAYEFHRDKLNEDERREVIEAVIGRRVGRSMRVQCILRADFVATAAKPASSTLPATIPTVQSESTDSPVPSREESADERMLGAVVRMFDGEIIKD